ncbi:MAG: pitrilysin family protein, partial [Gemmatimonadota bacterium]|nr:pitrilysin family protein [Gemmatimonadota bacterium]
PTVSMHLLAGVLEEALEFLATTIGGPAFPEREVARVRSERLDEIARRQDEPATVADHALIARLYGDGLYGRPVGGDEPTVSAIEPHDVRAYHAARYAPEGGRLLVCGDVEAEAVIDAVREHLTSLSGAALRVEPPAAPEGRGGDVILIDRPGSPQAEIRVGTIGVPFGTPDHHAIIVANAILGGLFNSRINMNLREDKGWTYGARSGFRFRRGAGPFVARTAVETGVTAAAFEEILAEIETMTREPASGEELELAKHALTLSLPLQFETASQITSKVSRQRIYDLPDDYWEEYRERIEAVTAEQVLDVCRAYLSRERLTLLAVTDGDAAEEGLESLGDVERRASA